MIVTYERVVNLTKYYNQANSDQEKNINYKTSIPILLFH